MTYSKPQLRSYAALSKIKLTGPNAKTTIGSEPNSGFPSQPAYEADE